MSVAALERRAEAFTVWAQLERRLLRPSQTFDQYVELFLPGRCA
jgi:hypothetical protein